MKKFVCLVVVAVCLNIAGIAVAGGYHYDAPPAYYYEDPGYYYEGPYYDGPYYVRRSVAVPEDIRVSIAEYEKLKARMHYYSLSGYPGDRAKADRLAAEMEFLDRRIEAWRWRHNRRW
jgi:hypothetical protein